MNPIGLHHIMGTGHHYGPAPWVSNLQSCQTGILFIITKQIVLALVLTEQQQEAMPLAQYFPEARKQWEDITTCDEKYLLWFHHVPWNYKMKSGKTLWNELCQKYYSGADSVRWMQE